MKVEFICCTASIDRFCKTKPKRILLKSTRSKFIKEIEKALPSGIGIATAKIVINALLMVTTVIKYRAEICPNRNTLAIFIYRRDITRTDDREIGYLSVNAQCNNQKVKNTILDIIHSDGRYLIRLGADTMLSAMAQLQK